MYTITSIIHNRKPVFIMKYHVKTQMWFADVWSARQSETRFENLCWGANILIWSFSGEKAPVLLINGSVITHYICYFLSQRLICFMYVFSAIHSSFIGERKFHSSLTIVYSTIYSGAEQRKYQTSTSLAFVGGIHQWPVNSPHKGPVTRKMSPFDDVIMYLVHQSKNFNVIFIMKY